MGSFARAKHPPFPILFASGTEALRSHEQPHGNHDQPESQTAFPLGVRHGHCSSGKRCQKLKESRPPLQDAVGEAGRAPLRPLLVRELSLRGARALEEHFRSYAETESVRGRPQ